MTELAFQVAQPQDLALLLQLAQRLGIPYVQKPPSAKLATPNKVKDKTLSAQALRSQQLALLRQAANDPLFRADMEEVMADFAHADPNHPIHK